MLTRVRLGLRAFEWLPFPWRFSRLDPAPARTSCGAWSARASRLHHELLLMAKIFSTLGYASTPEVEERIGLETSCRLADGALPEPAGSLGDTERRRRGRGMRRRRSSAPAPAARPRRPTLAEAGLDVIVLEAGGHYDRDNYPRDPLDAIASPLPRRRPDDRRGPPADPGAGREGGRRHDGDQLRHLLPRPRAGAGATGATRYGIAWAGDLDPDFAEAEEFLRVTPLDPERMGRNGQLAMEGAAAIGASGGPISRNAGNCVQCSSCPFGCEIDAKRGMHVSYLPRAVAAGARMRAGVEARRVLVEDGRAAGVRVHRRPPAGNGGRRAYTVRARRATIVAGGALGTPELLLRSGLGGGQVGRNLHIHPACWVGARYEEEVRGWEGVMQSYYVDEWEPSGVLLEATFTPLAFGGAWLLGAGREHQEAMLDFGHVGSIGVQLSDRSAGPGRAGRRRLAARQLRADRRGRRGGSPSASPAPPRSTSPPARPRSTPTSPRAGVLRPGDGRRVRGDRASSPPSCASRPSTRWARRGSPPIRARASARPTARVHGVDGLYVADASLFPTARRRQPDDDRSSPSPSGSPPGSRSDPDGAGRASSGAAVAAAAADLRLRRL